MANACSKVDWYVNFRLKKWAAWSIKCINAEIGYPSRSVEGRLMDDGGILSKSSAPFYGFSNEECEEIEAYINELVLYKPKFARALKLKYFSKNIKNDLEKIGMSKDTYHKHLQGARVWFAAKIGRIKKS